jgi:hypothetical protein
VAWAESPRERNRPYPADRMAAHRKSDQPRDDLCVDEFRKREGGNSVVEGHGGTRKVVDGMDVWTHGDPARRFQVLGLHCEALPEGMDSMPPWASTTPHSFLGHRFKFSDPE